MNSRRLLQFFLIVFLTRTIVSRVVRAGAYPRYYSPADVVIKPGNVVRFGSQEDFVIVTWLGNRVYGKGGKTDIFVADPEGESRHFVGRRFVNISPLSGRRVYVSASRFM